MNPGYQLLSDNNTAQYLQDRKEHKSCDMILKTKLCTY